MKNMFNQLGYSISENQEVNNATTIQLYYITNTDGSIRWAWPAHVKKPLFLKFYNIHSLKTKLYSAGMKTVFALGLQSLFFKTETFSITKNEGNVHDFNIEDDWALFKGTIGPNNKSVLYLNKQGNESFIKIANTPNAQQLIHQEMEILCRLEHSQIETFEFPEVMNATAHTLQLSDVSKDAERQNYLAVPHINALIELNELTAMQMPLNELENWHDVKQTISDLQTNLDERMPKGMIRKLNQLVNSINEEELIEVGTAHGDFTPWNLFVKQDKLHIYDWELADMFKPLGFDAFHFIVQQGVLVEHKNWGEIKKDIDAIMSPNLLASISKFYHTNVEQYLKLYLIHNTAYYLKLYAAQPVWHTQVNWLLNVWNDALSSCNENTSSQRELLLMDTFDFLATKKYGTIKFKYQFPEELSEFSDVDMCIEKENYKALVEYLKNHSVVSHYSVVEKSFMATAQFFCKDGNCLSLDLIWKIKRKELELMDVKSVLKNTFMNNFGVKMLDTFDNARYVGLFYKLNNAPIPTKFNYYEEILSHSTTKLDKQLYPYFVDENCDKKNLLSFIKKQKANRKFKGLANKINYIIDTVKSVISQKGTIITFSGVDGAGKTTVINNLKYKIEKQLRKKVILLRHRPSLLPILSAWTKGKAQAEKDAASNLPRLGSNKSGLSSLLRFAYYYMDYLFGQFVIQVKYVRRGYVVIYDRYYFDFINDSKRSNIVLPSFISKIGFAFLLKPKFNFFLYADAETILERKKELDVNTIKTLTTDYLNQFERLDKRIKRAHFTSINNVNLTKTLNTVFANITKEAA